jgi:hypothetical protein
VADQNINPVGCLGRVLTVLGTLWLGFIILGGIGVLSDVGVSEGFFAGAFGSAIPGVLLLWAGRALRRRARTMETQIEPVAPAPVPGPTEKRVPTIRVEPSPVETPPPPPVKPAPKPVSTFPIPKEPPQEDLIDLPPPLIPPEPKTSRQLIDEARKKWGRPRT